MNHWNRIFVLLLTFVYVMACNTIKKEEPNIKRVWMLTEYNQYSKDYLTKKQAFLDLTQPEKASSKMGCNQLSFPYTITNTSEIKFSNGIATRMYCDDMKLEDSFSKEITSISNYSIQGHQLILTSPKGIKMIFVAQDWD
jgi:heat shock protein HslJ